jgi:hypothetical protein
LAKLGNLIARKPSRSRRRRGCVSGLRVFFFCASSDAGEVVKMAPIYGGLFRAFSKGLVAAALVMPCLLAVGTFAAQDDSAFDIAGLQAIRGVVVKTTAENVFVKVHSGTVYEVETGANTHFVKNGEATPKNGAKAGDTILAGGELDQKKHTLGAIFFAVVDAAELAQLDERRAQWGKTWLAGTIVAKQGTELTVKRPDGVVAKVLVDEDTSFKKKHESITYPQIQVGDGMTATGVEAKNVFAAKVLTVVDAAEIREWSRLKDQ